MEVDVVDFLMCQAAVVLEDIVVFRVERFGDAAGDREELGEGVVGDFVEFGAVVFGNYELEDMLGRMCGR